METKGTYNRGKLLREVKAGKWLCECNHSYTDDYLFDVGNNFGKTPVLPARIREPHTNEWGRYDSDFVDGFINLYESDFRGKPGTAWEYVDGTVCLVVHSNCSYTFHRKPENNETKEGGK